MIGKKVTLIIFGAMITSAVLIRSVVTQDPKIKRIIVNEDAIQLKKYLESSKDPNELFFRAGRAPRTRTTPLHYAAMRGNVEMCNILIAYGANANGVDYDSMSPLQWVFAFNGKEGSKEDVIELLWPKTNLKHCDRFGQNVLHHVAQFGTSDEYKRYSMRAPELKLVMDNVKNTPEDYFRIRHSRVLAK